MELSIETLESTNFGDHGERLRKSHAQVEGETVEELVARVFPQSAYSANAGNRRPWMDAAEANGGVRMVDDHAPVTDDARAWEGWGTALKPAFEPVVVARKPLAGTVAANVLTHGTGALNIDGCRVGDDERERQRSTGELVSGNTSMTGGNYGREVIGTVTGRWPANVVLDESQAVELDQQSGDLSSGSRRAGTYGLMGYMGAAVTDMPAIEGDTGGASRFFYVAKADQGQRVRINGTAHPTVKPLALMRWLARLVTPPGGVVLEPFAGSGTTVEACILEGFRCIAIEREADYLPLITQRIHRRRDPVAAVKAAGGDAGLFELLGDSS